jgi:serine/threonine-protein phosphatase 2A regulatory subunit A
MSAQMEAATVTLELLPLVLEMSTDLVANIRFNVAKALEQIATVCGPQVYGTQVRPVLEVLLEDQDRDVRFFANKTFKVLEAKFEDAMQS